MTIYQRIKDLSNSRNLSVRELEKQLNFSNGTLNKWDSKAPSEKLEQVADYFGVSVDYLLGRDGNEPSSADLDLLAAIDQARSVGGRQLTDKDRAQMKAVINALLNVD